MLYIEIDLGKLKGNLEKIARVSGKKVIPVIKSDAYRLGAARIAQFLAKEGVELFAVVDLQEAVELAETGFSAAVLILNGVSLADYPVVDRYENLVMTVGSLREAVALRKHPFTRPVRIHFQIDTGMNRLGFRDIDEFREALNVLAGSPILRAEGIYTHFTDLENARTQVDKFTAYVREGKFEYVHCAASIAYDAIDCGNHVRVGIDLYGSQENTEQTIRVVTKPLVVWKVRKGDTVGYDRAYRAEDDELIAVLPIGYNNGFRRSLAGFPVLANNRRYPTVGKVCMNHLFVRVDESVNEDTEFIITSSELPISEMARYLGTVPHEILCMLNIQDKRYIGG
jgi:alanine racemase